MESLLHHHAPTPPSCACRNGFWSPVSKKAFRSPTKKRSRGWYEGRECPLIRQKREKRHIGRYWFWGIHAGSKKDKGRLLHFWFYSLPERGKRAQNPENLGLA